ncbi:hypothetical protein ACFO0S_07155 [Chryseomicrobium palamuruense]|uniref:Uncharacterized protein n=1 Tax=Chryseomicrobium palamuruense TaxID=682973 RepID=A0ABV8UWC0_9BACL
MKFKKLILIFILVLIVFLITFYIYSQNTAIQSSTTENIQVIKKDNTTEEHWIVISNGKQIYIENFSIWALIQENENYTIIYDEMKKSGRYKLRTIVPGDYNGQF